jgi:cyclomaltodextrinase / maltogenic alpha-amylase / neopullulanase
MNHTFKFYTQSLSKVLWANVVLVLICISCKNPKPEVQASRKDYIAGLATPVRLNFDTTKVLLADYFPDVSGIDSISFKSVRYTFDKAKGEVMVLGNLNSPVGNMQVYYKGMAHDIPVFASEKVKHHIAYKATSPAVKEVEMSGSMNGWNRKATQLKLENGLWVTDLVLNPGLFQYRIWEDGKEMLDGNNPEKIDNGMGGFNSTFQAGSVNGEAPFIYTVLTGKSLKSITISAVVGVQNMEYVAYYNNELLTPFLTGGQVLVEIPERAKSDKVGYVRVYAHNGQQRSNDILVPVAKGEVVMNAQSLDRKDMHASVMYFMMVDRFNDGDASNNRPTNDPAILAKANNLGGDISGITQKIKDGYFKNLGVNTLWISPISRNAEGAWGLWDKGATSKFSAYHGYWPTALKEIDDRYGNDAQFRELIDVAHKNRMNVVLDYVAHHVHQDHPLYKAKPEWTTPLYLPDGTMNTEKWDEHRLTTWFDTFLPTWNFANPEVVSALTDTAMYWVENYDLDGFRHDATKHIPEEFWRTLTHKVKAYNASHPDRSLYQVGETYGNPELISSYISSGQMDAQFDFNLYDAAVDAFAKDETNFKNLDRVLKESLHYYGGHNLMGNITGNQDRARFISYADGSLQFSDDPKLIGWTKDIGNRSETGFKKLEILSAFLMTTPGIPCIYYGDEIGMPGANDPDNRRMMHFNDWNDNQKKLFDAERRLIELRRNNLSLIYGDLKIIASDEKHFVYMRTYFGHSALVVISKQEGEHDLTIELPLTMQASAVAFNGSKSVFQDKKVTLSIKGQGYEILVD